MLIFLSAFEGQNLTNKRNLFNQLQLIFESSVLRMAIVKKETIFAFIFEVLDK